MIALTSLLSSAATDKNPFDNGSGGTVPLYLQPDYVSELQASISSSQGLVHDNLQVMANTSTAFWVDTKAKIPAMADMLTQAATKSPPELVTIVVYDVPNRDCASNNSERLKTSASWPSESEAISRLSPLSRLKRT